jgi:hypothetical protein
LKQNRKTIIDFEEKKLQWTKDVSDEQVENKQKSFIPRFDFNGKL